MTTNNGRPLPWHDTASCERKEDDGGYCGGPMVPGERSGRIVCAACGCGRTGSPEDVAKTSRSANAWALLEAGLIHADRGCAKCGGPLPLDRERLCAPCVEKDNAERQGVLL